MTRRIRPVRGKEDLSRTASIERARQTPQASRTRWDQLDHGLGGGKHLIERTSSEVDGTNSAVDDIFVGAWDGELGELGRERCGWQKLTGERNDAYNEFRGDELDGRTSA